MARRRRLRFAHGGKTAIALDESSSGQVVSAPVADLSGGKIHLTLTKEDGAIGAHIADKQGPVPVYTPLPKQSAETLRALAAEGRLTSRSYDPDEPVWVPTSFGPKGVARSRKALVSLEVASAALEPNLGDARTWYRTTARDVADVFEGGGFTIALARRSEGLVLVMPMASQGKTYEMPLDQFLRSLPKLMEALGFGAYLRYLHAKTHPK